MDWADYLRDQAAKYRQLAKPTFVRVSVSDGVPRWLKVSAAIAAVVGAVFTALAFAKQASLWNAMRHQRSCSTRWVTYLD
jgi:hypothetical protein